MLRLIPYQQAAARFLQAQFEIFERLAAHDPGYRLVIVADERDLVTATRIEASQLCPKLRPWALGVAKCQYNSRVQISAMELVSHPVVGGHRPRRQRKIIAGKIRAILFRFCEGCLDATCWKFWRKHVPLT